MKATSGQYVQPSPQIRIVARGVGAVEVRGTDPINERYLPAGIGAEVLLWLQEAQSQTG